ncbi:Kinase family protein [Rhynchospora pubera]|uniref:Kinase family protein n=1 Tax=Rhynchospora pubera TaxID=906938 RepID=A0AAV8CA19_9POAL|nr:Kinase family protein [Rhynchospora pubera]
MGCIASKPNQIHRQKRLVSPETYAKMELSLRLLASRAADLRRRHRRRASDSENLLSFADKEFSPEEMVVGEVAPSTGNTPASAVVMLVFSEGEGEGDEGEVEMDTWQRRIARLEKSILPVAGRLVRFSYAEICDATRNFHKGRELGRGALSRVYRGKIGTWRRSVAIKKVKAKGQESLKAFCRELTIAGSLCNSNIVSLIGFCVDKEGLFIVYRFVSGGSLDRRLHHNHETKGRWKVMPWEERYKVAIGVARAIQYLHIGTDKCVIHRDIKPSNILLSSQKNPKLCDFGMATWTHGPSLPFLCKSVKGTFGYLAPEYFQHGKLSDKTDVYAFGVVLLELISGRKAIDRSRPPGEENLVLWAKPLLQQGEGAIDKLLDPHLNIDPTNHRTSHHRTELARVARAAAACLSTDESNRPNIDHVISMLQDHDTLSRDWSILTNSGCLSGYGSHYPLEKCEMRSHLALAMLGVSDTEEDDMYGR